MTKTKKLLFTVLSLVIALSMTRTVFLAVASAEGNHDAAAGKGRKRTT